MQPAIALVVLSGGQDSTTCLALAIQEHGLENVYAITFLYGQRHRAEIRSAEYIAALAGLRDRHEVVILPGGTLQGSSPIVNPTKAVEKYESAAVLPGGLEKTFVPMRNQLFLTLAANRAVCIAMEKDARKAFIYTGVGQEDYGGYPDCRAPFIDALERTIAHSLDDPELPYIEIKTPLMFLSKKATVDLSESIPSWSVPIEPATIPHKDDGRTQIYREAAGVISIGSGDARDVTCRMLLAHSHTCYQGEVPPCGKCHACLLREKGYAEAGIADPLIELLDMVKGHATTDVNPITRFDGRPGAL